jgi:hypothetical protein
MYIPIAGVFLYIGRMHSCSDGRGMMDRHCDSLASEYVHMSPKLHFM